MSSGHYGPNDIQSTCQMLTAEKSHAMMSWVMGMGILAPYLVESLLCQRDQRVIWPPNQTFENNSPKEDEGAPSRIFILSVSPMLPLQEKQCHLARGVLHNMLQAVSIYLIDIPF